MNIEVTERDGRVSVFACDDHGEALGWAWLDPGAAPGTDNVDVQVVPEHRRAGVGRALVGELLDLAAARGVGYLTCTHSDSAEARAFVRGVRLLCSRKVCAGSSKDVVLVRMAA